MIWLNDEDFVRAKVPMTKKNIRFLSILALDLKEGQEFLDIGSGTGSISVQAGLCGARVTAIERKEEGVNLLKEKAKAHGLDLKAIHGLAPQDLPDQIFDRVFIGGSAGNLKEIFAYLEDHLRPKGILVANFITLKNAYEMLELFKEKGYEDLDVELIQTAKMDRLGLMRGENPIYIMKGVKA